LLVIKTLLIQQRL